MEPTASIRDLAPSKAPTLPPMGILTDFYAAPRALADGILDGTKTKGFPKFACKGLDPVKLESLEVIAAKLAKAKGKRGETDMLTDEAAEQWVLLVSPRLVGLLAKEPDVDALVEAWMKTPELRADKWTAKAATAVVEGLMKLAVAATKEKCDVLLWMSL